MFVLIMEATGCAEIMAEVIQSGFCPECFMPYNTQCARELTEVCGHTKCRTCVRDSFSACRQCPSTPSTDVGTVAWEEAEDSFKDPSGRFSGIELCVECYHVFNLNVNRVLSETCGHKRCRICVCGTLDCRQCIEREMFDAYNDAVFEDGVVKIPFPDERKLDIEIGRGLPEGACVNEEESEKPIQMKRTIPEGLKLTEGDARRRDQKYMDIDAKQKAGEESMEEAITMVKQFNPIGKTEEDMKAHWRSVTSTFFSGAAKSSEAIMDMDKVNKELLAERDMLLKFMEENNIVYPKKPN